MVYWILWFAFSVALLGFTLARPHPYRFTRFLAFESILSLLFLNARGWFTDPFAIHQVISWVLLCGSAVLAGHGFWLIKSQGQPAGDLEDTTELITSGAYRYIRHPLYASLILLALGAYFKDPSALGAFLASTAGLGAFLTARTEERFNLERFGDPYREYMGRTKRFIPFIF
ncbi:MAG: methyltransferase family protein [Anaerolineales bacterium]|jgi:protein-S-isoprenylcysteine O-methyltransferase Ste14